MRTRPFHVGTFVCVSIMMLFGLFAQDLHALLAQESAIDWQADLEFLAKELPARHPDCFRFLTEEAFAEKVNSLSAKIGDMNDVDASIELMGLVASLGDAHTLVMPNAKEFHFIPVNVKWFKDGVYIRAIDEAHKDLVGAKLIGVGDKSAEEIVASFGEIFPHDNPWGLRKLIDIKFQTCEYLRYAGAVDDSLVATLHVEKEGKKSSIELRPIAVGSRNVPRFANGYSVGMMKESVFLSLMIKDERGHPYWNEWLPDQKTVYFKYNRCVDGAKFAQLVKSTAAFIDQNDVEKFVLDLRDNAGGDSRVFAPLFQYLSQHQSLNQKGRLFVITGRRTFSSALFAVRDMRTTNAIFVGEPTGGSPNHFGEVKSFELPSSKLSADHSSKFFQLQAGKSSAAYEPDIEIEFRAGEVFAARDQALQAIFDYKVEVN